jgi:hypothetical protein
MSVSPHHSQSTTRVVSKSRYKAIEVYPAVSCRHSPASTITRSNRHRSGWGCELHTFLSNIAFSCRPSKITRSASKAVFQPSAMRSKIVGNVISCSLWIEQAQKGRSVNLTTVLRAKPLCQWRVVKHRNSSADVDVGLLCCNVVSFCRWIPTVRRDVW